MGGKLSKQELRCAVSAQLTNNSGDIIFLSKADEKESLKIFADAFQNDPLVGWVAALDDGDPDRKKKLLRMSWYLLAFVNNRIIRGETGFALGIRYQDQLVGCMSVVPSGCPPGVIDDLKSLVRLGSPPMFRESTKYGPNSKKRLNCLDQIDAARKRHMKDIRRWIYLQSIGIASEYQHGRGFGSKLLRLLILVADSLNVPIYLETESVDLQSMYMHFGFCTMEEFKLCINGDDSVMIMYLMRRDPTC